MNNKFLPHFEVLSFLEGVRFRNDLEADLQVAEEAASLTYSSYDQLYARCEYLIEDKRLLKEFQKYKEEHKKEQHG